MKRVFFTGKCCFAKTEREIVLFVVVFCEMSKKEEYFISLLTIFQHEAYTHFSTFRGGGR